MYLGMFALQSEFLLGVLPPAHAGMTAGGPADPSPSDILLPEHAG